VSLDYSRWQEGEMRAGGSSGTAPRRMQSNRHTMGAQRRSSCIVTRSSLSMDPPVGIVLTRLDHFPAVLPSIRGLDCSLATVRMRKVFTLRGWRHCQVTC
jgi:hypothetical protein